MKPVDLGIVKPSVVTPGAVMPSVVALVLVWAALLSANAQAPHLLLGTADFTRLNELASSQPWASKQREKILNEAAAFPASYEKAYGLKSLELPPEGGAWNHLYVCPDTGSRLAFHAPKQNVCPDTGKVYRGYPYDQVVYQMRADALEQGALTAALAYRLAGDHDNAVKAATILKLYADKYNSYPLHDKDGKVSSAAGRVFAQTLNESIFLIDIAWTYDLLRDTDVLNAADRAHIEKDLLRAAVVTITRGENAPTENIRSWITGAIAAVGFTLDDRKLIALAIDGPQGFHFQMRNWVKDGFWTEGALGYQFYAMKPLELMAQMAARKGIDLWQTPNLRELFASPVGLMLPDGSLPAFNDARVGHLYEHASLYELAYAVLHEPLFAAICEHEKRNSREAFLFGVPSIDGNALPRLKSEVFPNAGYATLRAPTGDLTEIVKFGPTGEVHGHFDKLNEVIYAKGGFMSVDPGTQEYGMASHYTWDRMSIAHNTVTVDETTQKPAVGRLLAWQSEPAFAAVTADAGPVYAGIDLIRTSMVTTEYALEVTTGASTDGKEHDFDWSYHNYGVQHAEGSFAAYAGFPQRDGYQHLSENQTAQLAGDFKTEFVISKDRTMQVWVSGAGVAQQAFTGMGLGQDLRVKIPYAIVRQHGARARFIAVFQPGPSSAVIRAVRVDGDVVHVVGDGWEDTIRLSGKLSYERSPRP